MSFIVVVLAVVGLATPAGSTTATCPSGQAGAPTYCTTPSPSVPPVPEPSNKLKLGRARPEGLGVVALKVTIPYPGRLLASGEGMRKLRETSRSVGIFTVKLRLTHKGLSALRASRGQRLRVKVTFVFTPTGGVSRAKVREITFRS